MRTAPRPPFDWPELRAPAPAGLLLVAADPRQTDPEDLFADERALLPPGDLVRAGEFTAGRVAARQGLATLGAPTGPLLSDAYGAPTWPAGFVGSITHKPELCLVAVADRGAVPGIGLDLEETAALPELAWPVVLAPGEIERHAGSGGALDPTRTRLSLCAKEAFYKWRYSVGARPPDLLRVEVDLDDQGLELHAEGPLPRSSHVIGEQWTAVLMWSAEA